MSSVPAWSRVEARSPYHALDHDARADVCVIGAGVVGLSVAYMLAREGRRVIVIDQGPAGSGESRRTTAHLTYALDLSYAELEAKHGAAFARLAAQSHEVAIKRIHAIVGEESLDCGFEHVDGYKFAGGAGNTAALDEELLAVRRAGLDQVERLDCAPLAFFDSGPCLHFPRQAQLDAPRYLAGLARAVVLRGGRIYTGTSASSVHGGLKAEVTTSAGRQITAGAVVVATNSPFMDRLLVPSKQAAYRSYVVAARVPAGAVAKGLYWDCAKPYHFVRLYAPPGKPELLMVGGEDHLTGQADDAPERYARLESWMRERFPVGRTAFRWSGQIVESVDGLALIGRNPMDEPNVYIATGHSGNGITYGMIAGILLGDLIQGRPNEWAAVYDPGRITPGAIVSYSERAANAARQYGDWAPAVEQSSRGAIPPNSGGVVEGGAELVAAYRDHAGVIHEMCAVCPHLGGIVRWNSSERSWDCPVHGARYGPCGNALNGPAPADLSPAKVARAS